MKKSFLILVILLLVSMVSMVGVNPVGGDSFTITAVTLRIKTWKSSGGNDYMRIYLYNGTIWSSAYTVTPTSTTAPGTYVSVNVFSFLDTIAKIDAAQMRIEKITVDTEDTIGVDHAQLRLSWSTGSTTDVSVSGRLVDATWDGWTRTGASPWLNAADYVYNVGNYIYTSVSNDKIGNFTFQDVPDLYASNIVDSTIQPKPVQTIRPMADSTTFTDWTYNTLTIRPNAEGTYTDWTGRILTLKPNDHGTFSEWSSWVYVSPNGDGNYTDWSGGGSVMWDEWPTSDGDTTTVYVTADNRNQTSTLALAPNEPRALPITKVRLNIVAKRVTGDENLQMMLATTINENVSSFTAATGWNGWNGAYTQVGGGRNGTIPYLGAADYPSNYIYTSVSNDKIGNFTFQDIPTGTTWSTVTLRLKTWTSGLANDQLKIYLYNGASWTSNTITPTNTTAPGSYVDWDVTSFLDTEAKVNAAKMALEKLTSGTADTIGVDHAYLLFSNVVFQENVDGRVIPPSGWNGWTKTGSEPYLGAADHPSNYIYTSVSNDKIGNFTFQDIPTGTTWTTVTLYIKTWQDGDDSLKIYLYNGATWTSNTIYPDIIAAPGNYKTWDVSGFLNTATKINAAKMALEKLTSGTGKENEIGVDHAYLSVSGVSTYGRNVNDRVAVPGWVGWKEPGKGWRVSPWLNSADYPLNYIYTSVSNDKIGNFTFQDIPLGTTWTTVTLRLKTWQNGNDQLKIYLYNGTSWQTYTITPDNTGAPGNYKEIDVTSFLRTEGAINLTKMALEKITVDTEDTIDVDHAQLRVSGVSTFDANVDGMAAVAGWDGWTIVAPGTGPWLDFADYPSNYISTNLTDDMMGDFSFANVPSYITWNNVQLRLRVWQNSGGDDTIRIYVYDGSSWSTGYTLAVTPSAAPSYRVIDVSDFLNTATKINAAQMRIEKVTVGTPDTIYLDHTWIRVSGVRTSSSYAATTTLTTSYASYFNDWSNNPFWKIAGTDQPWNWTAINDLQAGVKSVQYGTSWLGSVVVTQLYVGVLTDGLYTEWNEWPIPTSIEDKASGCVFVTAGAKRQSSALINHTTENWNILKVRVGIVAKDIVAGGTVQPILVIGGTVYTGTTATLTTTYAEYSNEWTTNPGWNNNPWNWTAIDALQAGVYSVTVASGHELRVTQLFVKVIEAGTYAQWDDTTHDANVIERVYDAGWNGWTRVNATPSVWLDFADYPSNYIYTSVSNDKIGNFTFQDIPIGLVWHNVTLRLKTWQSTSGDDTLKIYLYDGTSWSSAYTVTPSTTVGSYRVIDVSDFLNTIAKINAAQMAIEKITSDTADTIYVDHAYMRFSLEIDGDVTYNSAISNAMSRSSHLENVTSSPPFSESTITRVQVTIVAKTDISTDEKLQIMLRVGTTEYFGTAFALSTSYQTYTYLSPVTLTWAQINDTQAGVKSVQAGTEWKGEIRVTQLYVVVGQAGTFTEWDEATQNGDTDYVSTTMKDMTESSVLQDPTHQTWDIARVRVVFYARATAETTDEKVAPILVVGGEAWKGRKEYTLTTTYAKYTGDWGKNPATDDYWTWNDIDALGAGVTSIIGNDGLWTGEIRVTQLYVEVAGPRFMVYVRVENITDLYGYEFFLNYTTATLTAASISLGGWFPYEGTQIYHNEINDDLGYVWYSVGMPFGSPAGKTGSGILANVTFFPDSYGSSVLDICNTIFGDHYANLIAHEINDGYFSNKMIGDVDANRKVDVFDLFDVGKAYDTDPTKSNWNIECDFNRDDKVNATDLSNLSTNYGTSF